MKYINLEYLTITVSNGNIFFPVELGFDVKSLSEILGHASVNITMNRYVHPSMELKQKNMNLLSELLTTK